MRIPQLKLESIPAKLSIQTTKDNMTIEQPEADLSIKQPKADLTIRTTPARLTIDQTKAREDVNLKSSAKRIEEAAAEGRNAVLEGIARRAQQGDQLMNVKNGGNVIAQLAKVNSERPKRQFNIGFIPSAGSVKINYEPSKVNVDVQVNKPIIDAKLNKPIINYQPGKVEIELERKNELHIDFEQVTKGE